MSQDRTTIDERVIAEIKSRVKPSTVIGRTVKLKRVGNEFVGLSPFKNEKTPSFTVSDEKLFYHDFSSGKHGDVIDFLVETRGLSFRQAVEELAAEPGVDIRAAPEPTKVKSAPMKPVCHYEYQDETGFPYMRVTRYEPKTFRQFHWDCDGWASGKPKTGVIPYRLPEIVARPNNDIWLVEGEKDADTLAGLGLLATTAPGGATAFPRDDIDFLKWFDGRRVYAIPDNDEAGAKWRERVAHGIADVKFLHLGGPKDVTEYIEAGHDVVDLVRLCDVDFDALDEFEPVPPSVEADDAPAPPRIIATPFQWVDANLIPPREWLFGTHLIRKFVSLTVSPGGLGKSSLALVEALSLSSGRALFPDMALHEPDPVRVWYWNGEDPNEETRRRVAAACLHYRLRAEDFASRFFADSGREQTITLGAIIKGEIDLDESLFDSIEQTMIDNAIDVLVLDPFVSAHRMGENDNNAIDAVIKRLGRLAERTNAAIEVVHHVRKPSSGSTAQTDVNDARGASALLGGVRSARVLNVMSEDIAQAAGVPSDLRLRHFSVSDGKANMAPKADDVRWRFLESICLGNATATRKADNVGVVRYYELPESAKVAVDMTRAQDIALMILARDDTVRNHNGRGPAPKNWLGYLMADELGVDNDTEAGKRAMGTIRSLIKSMIRDEAIHVRRANDERGHPVEYLASGARVDESERVPDHWHDGDDAPF